MTMPVLFRPGQERSWYGGTALVVRRVGCALFARLARSFKEYVMRLAVQKFGMQIFNDGLRQTLRLSFQEFEEQRSGETLAVLQKVRTDTERFISSGIDVLFSSLVGFGFLIWYSITKHWALIPIFFIGFAVLGSFTALLSRRIKTVQRRINRKRPRCPPHHGVTPQHRAGEESRSDVSRNSAHEGTYPDDLRSGDEKGGADTLPFLLAGTALILLRQSVLFTLLWLIFRQVLTTGELIAMQSISTTIFAPLQDLGNILVSYREAEASIQLFDGLMQKPVEHRPDNPLALGDLKKMSFNNVVFRHKTAMQNAIDGISFEVKTGETIAFAGPSGSGKSTLMKLLVGLYKPVEGEILFNDVDSRRIRYNEMRRQIGFVTQDTHLFAGTIRDTLLYVKPDATDEEILEALHKASCDQMLARSEKGILTILGKAD